MDRFETFRETVYLAYAEHGRNLPWRETGDPYRILVSEIMLQQTQVPRVIEKYREFLVRFPNVRTLAGASLGEVMAAWQGLGYNRRALLLKRMAEEVAARFGGEIPRDEASLRSLPGIGAYTASAVCAFAFNMPAILIETNIRSVFIHHFFPDRAGVRDDELLPLIGDALDRENPRRWYSALMDYGAHLKSLIDNPSRKSAHHVRQSRFEGSDRQIRGGILKRLVETGTRSAPALAGDLRAERSRVLAMLAKLEREGIVVKTRRSYRIA